MIKILHNSQGFDDVLRISRKVKIFKHPCGRWKKQPQSKKVSSEPLTNKFKNEFWRLNGLAAVAEHIQWRQDMKSG